jgi:transcriptional regulator with XRE-family HTH domain
MALCFAAMNDLGGATEEHPGHQIRRAREALGLSQAELGRRSKLGVRTVRRVEAGQGTPEGRTIAALRRTLGLPVEGAPDPAAVLRETATVDLIAELTRRLMNAERIMDRQRMQVGELPSEVPGKPGVLRGPDADDRRFGSDN